MSQGFEPPMHPNCRCVLVPAEASLPDPLGNPEFEQYPEAFRDEIGARFERGIERNAIATTLAAAHASHAWSNLRARDRERERRQRETAKLGDTLNHDQREQLLTKTRRARKGSR